MVLFPIRYDQLSFLYNLQAREYDPVYGLFVAPDHITPNVNDPQDLNRYAYARNNPLRYIDRSGEIPFEINDLRLVTVESNGSDGDYNATAKMESGTLTVDLDLANFAINWKVDQSFGEAEIRTIPDNPNVGAATLNGTYTWKDWIHPGNKPGGLPTVQLLTQAGSVVLPTAGPNPGKGGRWFQDGVNIHPALATNRDRSRRWNVPINRLADPNRRIADSPFSQGCHIPNPLARGRELVDFMLGHKGLYILNTKENQ